MRRFALLAVSLAFLFCGAAQIYAQSDPTTEQGLKPYGSFHGGDIDSISMVNLKPNIHIPLLSYPQRGQLSLGFSIVYTNPVYVPNVQCQPVPPKPQQCTAQYYMSPAPQIAIVPDFVPGIGCGHWYTPPSCLYYTVNESDGNVHRTGQIDTAGDFRSVDATGFLFNAGGSLLTDRNGTRYQYTYCCNPYNGFAYWYGTSIEDTNGNKITTNLTTQGGLTVATGWTDTLNRTIPVPPSLHSTASQPPSTGNPALCPTGAGLLPVYAAYAWTVPGYNGVTATYTVCTAALSLSYTPTGCNPSTGNYDCGGFTGETIYPTQSIVLPNGTAWSFEYDGAGGLAKIIFPTGGSISYTSGEYTNCLALKSVWKTYARAVSSRSVDANDGTGAHTWNYSQTFISSGLTTTVMSPAPFSDATVHTMTEFSSSQFVSCSVYETQVDHYQGSVSPANLLETTQTAYNFVGNPYDTNGAGAYQTTINVVPKSVTTIYPNGKTSQIQTDYDAGVPMVSLGAGANVIYGVQLAKREYDFPSGTALLRTTTNTYQFQSVPAYLTYNLLDLLATVKVTDSGGTQRALTTYGYDSGTPTNSGITTQHDLAPPNGNTRGSQTSVTRWLNSPAGNLVSLKAYFDTGEVYTSTTPRGNVTKFNPYMCTGAFPQVVTNAKNQPTTYNYDCNTGLLLSVKDPNNLTTSHTYDVMWRLAQTSYPNGGLDNYCYTDESGGTGCSQGSPPYRVVTTSKLLSGNMIKTDVYDGLGRISQHQLNSSPSPPCTTILTDFTYDADGRLHSESNPYCTTSDPTYGVTDYTYDALNRKTLVTDADGSTVLTAYCGPTTLVTDEISHWRRSTTDGLGRLIEVDEPNSPTATVNSNGCPGTGEPIWVTSYTYDALNNLATVTQAGSHGRSFVYDSVSRLLTSNNPEIASPTTGAACPITYTYDGDNNLATKVTPAPNQASCTTAVTTTYGYDALERLTGKTYSNGDPSVTYAYDGAGCLGLAACANIGHRTSMTDAGGSESFAFDSVNRKSADQRITNAITKTTSYAYDYNGATSTLTYPDGRIVTYAYNNAAEAISAKDTANSINYATGGTYTPPGGLSALTLGQTTGFTGINISDTYNKRLEPTELKAWSTAGTAFDLTYCFTNWVSGACQTTGGNNGNVNGVTNNLHSTRTQSFTYDQLNRIATATSSAWGLTFGYDSWANLLSATGTGTAASFNLPANANNHITTAPFAYDAAGNETADAAGIYTWNAEGELKTAGGVTYTYDGDGHRVQKSNGKLYWYGGGQVIEESDAAGNMQEAYVFFGGKRIANRVVSSGAISYYAEDFIGSSRVITTSLGATCYDADFYPYGSESNVTNTCPQNYKWTGKERDAETGNDDFDARYYSPVYGRFLSADWSAVPEAVPYANLTNPQTLNLYAIVRDNPESFADLDGHTAVLGPMACGAEGCGTNTNAAEQDQKKVEQQNQSAQQNQNQGQAKEQTKDQKQDQKADDHNKQTVKLTPMSKTEKILSYISCISGPDPDLISTSDATHTDPTDSTKETEGQRNAQSPPKKNGQQEPPLNPRGARSETPDNVSGAASWLANVANCVAVIHSYPLKKPD